MLSRPSLQDNSGVVGIGCLLQLMAREHVSITRHNSQTMIGLSITDDNVPSRIQIRVDTPAKIVCLDHYI